MRINPKYRHALGTVIHETRKHQELTQEELSELIDVSRRWIQKIESGESDVNWLNLLQLMVVLDLDPADLVKEVEIVVPVSAR